MNSAIEVFSNGHRARVVGMGKGSREARALDHWLSERKEVLSFKQRKHTGVYDIQYQDGNGIAGRFVRSLRDKLFSLFTREEPDLFAVRPVHSLPGRVRFHVDGLDDDERMGHLTGFAAILPGVLKVNHLPSSSTILVEYDSRFTSEPTLTKTLRTSRPEDWVQSDWERPMPLRWGGALNGTSVLLMCLSRSVPFPILAVGITFNCLRPMLRSAEALMQGEVSIDLLDVAATFAALATRRPATAAFVIWMVGVGDLLLDVSASSARNALSKLLERTEKKAFRVLSNGHTEEVSIDELEIGDRFVVLAGRGIAADGRVVSGRAEVDEKVLTGESRLLTKKKGDRVFASTVVSDGQIVVQVEFAGRNTEAAKIERILRSVGTKPLTLQKNALDFAGKLVLPTFAVAGLAGFLSGDWTRAICILITDFGTGIRITVPTSALISMQLAAREGVLVKGAQYLERLAKTDVIVFDKTGTLTNGVPQVVEIVTNKKIDERELMRLVASAETGFEHPVARACRTYADQHHIKIVAPKAGSQKCDVGRGVSAKINGDIIRVGRSKWLKEQGLKIKPFKKDLARFKEDRISSLCVAINDEVVGVVGYSDGTRPESAGLVEKLKAKGKRKVVLLSGDSPEVVQNVAHEVGIDEAVGGLLPDEKADYIKKLRKAGHVVAMVGDGINDVPALALADVGISIAGSTDVAIETADVILLDGGLVRMTRAFAMSDQAMERVRENLAMIIAPNAAAILMGALGMITPPIAAVINNGATLAAVLVGSVPLLGRPERQPLALPADPAPHAEEDRSIS